MSQISDNAEVYFYKTGVSCDLGDVYMAMSEIKNSSGFYHQCICFIVSKERPAPMIYSVFKESELYSRTLSLIPAEQSKMREGVLDYKVD